MKLIRQIMQPPWRTIVPGCGFLLLAWLSYNLWRPGLDVRDGRHDRGRNGIWLGHGWLGSDAWFIRNGKADERDRFRNSAGIQALADQLRRHHITDVFPHLCPAELDGSIPPVDDAQTERFLNEFTGFRVMPWIGGPNGGNVRLRDEKWRATFATNVTSLLARHPRLAGVQVNIEPLPSGDTDFLRLLDELRTALPKDKQISVAAYPPPTRWHPYADVHWTETYYREVAQRSDQLAIMMYDAAQRIPKTYQRLTAGWTREVLEWSERTPVLLGLPTYDDTAADYHDPRVENLTNALLGIHRGLSNGPLPAHYQGIAIYCEWETSDAEWQHLRECFLNQSEPTR